MHDNKITELYRGELWECQFYESILKDAGIECFIRNSNHTFYGPIVSPAQMPMVMINEKDMQEAISIIRKYNLNSKSPIKDQIKKKTTASCP